VGFVLGRNFLQFFHIFFVFFKKVCIFICEQKSSLKKIIHSMVQMLHNTKQFSRPVDSTRIDLAAAVLCGSCLKGNEWYEAPGARGEVGVMRT
jgi:hypothetical protein